METNYNQPLYDQIVHAPTSKAFSKAVRYLVTMHLYKVLLPKYVREEFINDISELYYQKFGYSGKVDRPLFDTLSELFMQEDVKANLGKRYTGAVTNNCRKLEYSFNSVRQDKTLREKPFDKVVPIGDTFFHNSSSILERTFWDGGMSNRENFLDIMIAADKAGLTEHQRDLIWLNGVVGLSVREIADLGAPYPSKSGVARRLAEAKKLLVAASN